MRVVALVALSITFYCVLAFGASIYGSYRYEPSGEQYLFLPMIAAPIALALASALAAIARSAGSSLVFALLPFLSVLVLALPAFGMPLSDQNLGLARWATVLTGMAHAALLAVAVRRG